ncbi:MAG: hypothetical protein QUS14_14745 [Pyrinomonadaceae bacterium]|nr:hypothetical protein [Pyrinomonadaceae bacterium]
MITSMIASEMGVDFGYQMSASAVFRAITEAVPSYSGYRYPDLKDETNPVQAKYDVAARGISGIVEALAASGAQMQPGEKIEQTPKIGHKLHRLTTMTSKTPQFHLLAHGNPKPENLLVSPLVQFELDGTPKAEGLAEAAAIGLGDRSNVGPGK